MVFSFGLKKGFKSSIFQTSQKSDVLPETCGEDSLLVGHCVSKTHHYKQRQPITIVCKERPTNMGDWTFRLHSTSSIRHKNYTKQNKKGLGK